MNDKEWNDTKQASPVLKIEVDFDEYHPTDNQIESIKVVNYIDSMIEVSVHGGSFTLSKADLLMLCIGCGIDDERYEFFYKKHILSLSKNNSK